MIFTGATGELGKPLVSMRDRGSVIDFKQTRSAMVIAIATIFPLVFFLGALDALPPGFESRSQNSAFYDDVRQLLSLGQGLSQVGISFVRKCTSVHCLLSFCLKIGLVQSISIKKIMITRLSLL